MARHNALGKAGEEAAKEYFIKKGFTIRETNWRCGNLELDLVVEKDGAVVFVEVKTRSENSLGRPSEAVSKSKQKKLILTAMKYMENEPLDMFSRFDVFEVWQSEGRIYKFNCIEAAFEACDFSGRYDIF